MPNGKCRGCELKEREIERLREALVAITTLASANDIYDVAEQALEESR
jgi:hypothetical protein